MLKKILKKFIANIICIFIKDKNKRKEMRKKIINKVINSNDIDKYIKKLGGGVQPIEPWAFIRVRNEIITIDLCLKSILPVIKKGVIGYNDCDDGTEEYIIEFCRKNSGFIPVKYPYPIEQAYNSDKRKQKKEFEKNLADYYNYVFSFIPNKEWVIKIDCDHIYNAQKLKKIFYIPQKDNDVVVLSRLDMHFSRNELYFISKNPLIELKDHWILKKDSDNHKFEMVNWEYVKNNRKYFASCEGLFWKKHNIVSKFCEKRLNFIYVELTNWHFPLIKNWRNNLEDYMKESNLVNFEEYKMIAPIGRKISEDMLDKNKIMEICKQFNFEKKKILP